MTYRLRYALSIFALSLLVACSGTPAPDDTPTETETAQVEPVHVRLLAFNDFHGALEGPTGSVTIDGERVEAGGAKYFAAHIAAEKGETEHTFVVAAGDLIGATPLISSLFHDEPTIEVMTALGLDFSSVGNHEFDAGVDELMRIVNGGCHPEEGCREGFQYQGTPWSYLAANVRFRESGETILPAYEIRELDGLKIAFIGMTLENTPSVVVPSAIESVTFHNEVETVNNLIPELNEKGVDSVVVLVHEGGRPTSDIKDINDCPDVQGSVVSIAEELHPLVSVIVSGHSHQPYICEFGGRLVTQAASAGRIVTVIDMHLDPSTGDLLERTARQRPVTRDIEPDMVVAGLVETYRQLSEPLAKRTVGQITADLPRGSRAHPGESPLGQLIADSQLAATQDEADAQIAFMNPGGIRASLDYNSDAEVPGAVSFADLHTVQPFGNILVTMTLTGAQIHTVLEQQWADENRPNILAVSSGFYYQWYPSAPQGERVNPDSITLHGEPIEKETTYRVTVNNFLSDGGDGFTILKEGTNRTGGVVDVDALATYLEAHSPLSPSTDTRIEAMEQETEEAAAE